MFENEKTNKRLKKYIVIIVIVIIAIVCVLYVPLLLQDLRYIILSKKLEKVRETPEYAIFMKSFSDTLAAWKARNISGVQWMDKDVWSVDKNVYFDTKKVHAFIFIVDIDTLYQRRDQQAMYFAMFKDSTWQFYSTSMIVGTRRTEAIESIEGRIEELSENLIYGCANGGYISLPFGEINDDWFTYHVYTPFERERRYQEFIKPYSKEQKEQMPF